jgi:uncharacterized protein YcbK (DUF882 family)
MKELILSFWLATTPVPSHHTAPKTSVSCVSSVLKTVIADVRKIASIRINSTCRSKKHNKRVGGAKNSYHLTGRAVDFTVTKGSRKAVLRFLRNNRNVGGIGVYRRHIHIDTGPRRYW